MYNQSQNPQVKYSLEQLSKSLFYYMQNKPFERVTVTEICQHAEITRRTFYRNVESKKDLVLFSTDYLVNELLSQFDINCIDPDVHYRNFFSFWYEHKKFLSSLYRNDMFDLFSSEFLDICNKKLRYPLQDESLIGTRNSNHRRIYSNAFVIGGLAQMLKLWASEEFSSSIKDITESIIFLSPEI